MNPFETRLRDDGLQLQRGTLGTLQINVGRRCNQSCAHCHVDAGPWRTEMMSEDVALRVGEWISKHRPPVVDITGGAPELSSHFRYFVEVAHSAGAHVMDRNNLTIIETEAFAWLPEYLARHEVEVVASLPCYSAENVEEQRGEGVFKKSISALRKLNAVGYGSRLPLNLVYNPVGPVLPGNQAELESDYKEVLSREYGIVFNRLFTITNQPIARFAEMLRRDGQWDAYIEVLAQAFNPATVAGLMCRNTLSIGWKGELYDCDFNQMLEMPLGGGKPLYLWEVVPSDIEGGSIQTGIHCLACTAGCGSSCTGEVKRDDRELHTTTPA